MLLKNLSEVEKQVQQVRTAAERTAHALRVLLDNEPDGLQVMKFIKFKDIGHHPSLDAKFNIIEQTNLSFTYLAKFEAARWLFARHPELQEKGIELNVASQSGPDIESLESDFLAAKVFSSSHPKANNKLGQDIRHLAKTAADVRHRYVFFSCPEFAFGRHPALESHPEIEVWSLPPELLLKSASGKAERKPRLA